MSINKKIGIAIIPPTFGFFYYKVFELLFRSNLPIPGFAEADPSGKLEDVTINLGYLPAAPNSDAEDILRYHSSYLSDTGEPALRIWEVSDGTFLRISYFDGTEFWLDRDLATLWAHWPASSTLEDTLSYLVGPVLGLLLRLRGVVCLHASAVSINDRSVIFVGSEGAGKSTTAAAFARQGFAVLSDDIVALAERESEFQVLPAYPRINLWPESVKLLYGSPEALPRLTADWDKRCLNLGETGPARFEDRPLRIGAIYVFGNVTAVPEACVETISQKTALMMLVGNTYATNFLDVQQRADEFMVLSRLVGTVPIRKINPRRDTVGLDELCEAIRQDFAGIDSPASFLDR